jgi:glycosyltransferase involved in cell wall biosynthesis
VEAQSSQLESVSPCSASRLRLLIDGRKLGHGGIGVYTENLIQGLLQLGESSITVISSKKQAESVGFSRDVEWIFDAARPYSLDELLFLSRRIPFSKFDLFHAPHYILPFGIPIPTVVTVHDLIHIEHPERFFYPMFAKPLLASAVSRATRVIAVSRDTQRAIISRLRAPASKVRYIPNAIGSFLEHEGARESRAISALSSRPYLLAVISNLKPHKGVEDLLRAYRSFKASCAPHTPCPDLFLVGFGAEKIRDRAGLRVLAEGIQGVHVLGAVEKAELRDLYRRARALVVPSLAEGFCLPALEAQACGTPVICRPVPAIRELLTEQDIVASDLSVTALASALKSGCSRSDQGRVVMEPHLKRFSLPVVARQISDLYGDVMRGEGAQ